MNHGSSRQRRPLARRDASTRLGAATLVGMRAATLVVIAALALVGCAATRDGSTAANTTSKNSGTVEARLIAVGGSAARGVVRFAPAGNSVSVSIFFSGVSPGDYRVALHTTGNCSSPNGFSAGPPTAVPRASPVARS
jgi:Cu/Zn superoxide dismutase